LKRQDQSAEHPTPFLAFLFHRFFFDPIKLLQPDAIFNLFAHLNEDDWSMPVRPVSMKTRVIGLLLLLKVTMMALMASFAIL